MGTDRVDRSRFLKKGIKRQKSAANAEHPPRRSQRSCPGFPPLIGAPPPLLNLLGKVYHILPGETRCFPQETRVFQKTVNLANFLSDFVSEVYSRGKLWYTKFNIIPRWAALCCAAPEWIYARMERSSRCARPPRLNSASLSRAEQAGQDCTGRIKYFPKDEERPISPGEAGPREKAPSSGRCAQHTKLLGLFCAC